MGWQKLAPIFNVLLFSRVVGGPPIIAKLFTHGWLSRKCVFVKVELSLLNAVPHTKYKLCLFMEIMK